MADFEKTIHVKVDTGDANESVSQIIKKIEKPVKLKANVTDAIKKLEKIHQVEKFLLIFGRKEDLE